MKQINRLLASLVLGVAMLGAAVPQALAAKEPAVILIVNFQALFAESKVGQDVNAQVQAQAKTIEENSSKQLEGFIAEARKLAEQKEVLGVETYKERIAALQKRQQEAQADANKKLQALQVGQARAQAEIEAVLKPIFAEVMNRHGGTVMLDQSSVLAGGVDLNVTAEIMQVLNERLPKLKVTPVDPAELQKQR